MFYSVTYKFVGKQTKTSIVQVKTKEEAILKFYNPKEVGLNAEIKEVKAVNKIQKGWNVSFENNGFPVTAKLEEVADLKNLNSEVSVSVGRRKMVIKVNQIIGASKASKDKRVMSRGVAY